MDAYSSVFFFTRWAELPRKGHRVNTQQCSVDTQQCSSLRARTYSFRCKYCERIFINAFHNKLMRNHILIVFLCTYFYLHSVFNYNIYSVYSMLLRLRTAIVPRFFKSNIYNFALLSLLLLFKKRHMRLWTYKLFQRVTTVKACKRVTAVKGVCLITLAVFDSSEGAFEEWIPAIYFLNLTDI